MGDGYRVSGVGLSFTDTRHLLFRHPPLRLIESAFQKNYFCGTRRALSFVGKHEMERAPAAITSLSAACRCASRPPSDPSVLLPKCEPGQKWPGSPAF
jgi:hypothetical protein